MDINQWNINYPLAQQYYEQNGNLLIPTSYEVDKNQLGIWISHLRRAFKTGKLTPDQINALNQIGMVWEVKTFGINHFYELAKKYYQINGHLLIPNSYEVDNNKVGIWINHLRQTFRNNILPVKYVKMLSSIGMVWNTKQAKLINKIRKQINVSSKDMLLNAIEQTISYYLEDNLTSIMSYFASDISLSTLKEKAKLIGEIMREVLPITNYQMASLYICGFEVAEIAQIYKVTPTEVEKIRLATFNLILKDLEINNTNKTFEKSIK